MRQVGIEAEEPTVSPVWSLAQQQAARPGSTYPGMGERFMERRVRVRADRVSAWKTSTSAS